MTPSTSSPPPPLNDSCESIQDPPPPYPRRERRTRTTRSVRGRQVQHVQIALTDSHADLDTPYSHLQLPSSATHEGSTDDDEAEPTETTPFLVLPSPRTSSRHFSGRPRSFSRASTLSAAPSLTRTVLSLFQTEDDNYLSDDSEDRSLLSPGDHTGDGFSVHSHRPAGFFTLTAWKRYFRPMVRMPYYKALFHLTFINFPYAVLAWVYLFVFTLTGTTLLMALPLGAVLCFFNLLGARSFARGELALQTRFHSPLAYAPPYPPRPIFSRLRPPTLLEIEAGTTGFVRETSFYKNTYAMFTDPTSYQALFYFLVIKPAITLLFSLIILVLIIPTMILVLPAPIALRAVRKLGLWQANVAVEGLYLAVR